MLPRPPPPPAQGTDGRTPRTRAQKSGSPPLGASACADERSGFAQQQSAGFLERGFGSGFAAVLCGEPWPQPGGVRGSSAGAGTLQTDRCCVARRVSLIRITGHSFLQKLLGLVALILRSALEKITCFFSNTLHHVIRVENSAGKKRHNLF